MPKFIVRAVQVITQNATFEVDVPEHFDGVEIDDPESFATRAVSSQTAHSPDQDLAQFVSLEDADDETVLENVICGIEEVK